MRTNVNGARSAVTMSYQNAYRKIAEGAFDVFGSAPFRSYWFLIQDGADDALEHRASVTVGAPSNELARNPRARLNQIAHEFFHTWNLVAIHPDDYGQLMNHRVAPTRGLWLGEGVTLHYADVLARRAGQTAPGDTRVAHLEMLLSRYYVAPWSARVSPEAASLAFGASLVTNPDATGGYYLQGELIGQALDAAIRDSTRASPLALLPLVSFKTADQKSRNHP
jgi:predicted metalloprotease with PDZ domain